MSRTKTNYMATDDDTESDSSLFSLQSLPRKGKGNATNSHSNLGARKQDYGGESITPSSKKVPLPKTLVWCTRMVMHRIMVAGYSHNLNIRVPLPYKLYKCSILKLKFTIYLRCLPITMLFQQILLEPLWLMYLLLIRCNHRHIILSWLYHL